MARFRDIQPVATLPGIVQTCMQRTVVAGTSADVLAAMVLVPTFMIGELVIAEVGRTPLRAQQPCRISLKKGSQYDNLYRDPSTGLLRCLTRCGP